ncbi:MAG: S-layer homology domain-containing protein, partial [Peptococcus niger]|nr:S-layer homology domain-containing protein [Peptococcus niger]
MKRLLSILLAAALLLSVVPSQVFAEEAPAGAGETPEVSEEAQPGAVGDPLTGDENVTLVGQWINDSSEKVETKKHYELTDKIGNPEYNSGLLRSLAKQFLGWSDKAPVGNGVLADGAKLFSPEDTIADVFGSTIPSDAKIYAVYYEVNNPYGDPFPQDPFSVAAVGNVLDNLKSRVNKNEVTINKHVKPDDVLNKTDLAKAGDVIVDYYQKKDDVNDINEVVLKSEFKMDWAVAMLAYRNKSGSNAIRPILSYDYNERYKNNDFSTKDGEAAGYTYVDLNMDFGTDEGLVIPDNLFLEFKSYTWRPLYAFGINEDGTKTVLQILGKDGKEISEVPGLINQGDFEKIGSGDKPETTFGVVTKANDATGQEKKYRKITVRVVLREWDNSVEKPHQTPFSGERIPESNIPKGPEGTIASEVLSNMTLSVLGSADKINNETIKNESIVRISDAKAKALADGEAKETIDITGSVQGHIFASAGSVEYGRFSLPLASNLKIKNIEVEEPVKLSYIHKKEEPKPEPKPDTGHQGGSKGGATTTPSKPEPKPEEPDNGDLNKADHYQYLIGYPDGTFAPNKGMTRAEVATMFTRLLKDRPVKGQTYTSGLSDIYAGDWYADTVGYAVQKGIVSGYPDGTFKPNQPITRAEFSSIASRFADLTEEKDLTFSDLDASHWGYKAIRLAASNGWISGYPDNTFRPEQAITRAEVTSITNRMLN